jgi:hypothetical protein
LLNINGLLTTWLETVKQNKLCNIWGFHGSDYEERRLLGYYAMWLL